MSGKKQHTIPQFFQRNFSNNRKQLHCYTLKKNFKTNISNNLAERYFYSNSNDTTLDDKITNAEAEKYSLYLDYLLKKEGLELDLNYKDFKDFFIFSFLRTQSMRDFYFSLREEFLNQLMNLDNEKFRIIISKKNLEKIFQEMTKEDEELFNLSMESLYPEIEFNKEYLLENIDSTMESIDISEFRKEFEKGIKKYLDNKRIEEKEKDIYRKDFLEKALFKENEAFFDKSFKFSIIRKEYFILSDNLMVFEDQNNEFSCLENDINRISSIYFPLSKNKILIIHKNEINEINEELINDELIKVSSERFLYFEENTYYLNKKEIIGINRKKIDEKFIEDNIDNIYEHSKFLKDLFKNNFENK